MRWQWVNSGIDNRNNHEYRQLYVFIKPAVVNGGVSATLQLSHSRAVKRGAAPFDPPKKHYR